MSGHVTGFLPACPSVLEYHLVAVGVGTVGVEFQTRVVEDLATDAVAEVCGKREFTPCQFGLETSEHLGCGGVADDLVGLGIFRGNLSAAVLCSVIPLCCTGLGVHACPFLEVEGVAAVTGFEEFVGTSGNAVGLDNLDVGVVTVEFLHLVGVVAEGKVEAPLPVVRTYDVTAEGDFYTVVAHLADILPTAGNADDAGHGHHIENVVSILVVPVEVEAQTAVEQAGIETHADGACLLPCEVLVANLADECCGSVVIAC